MKKCVFAGGSRVTRVHPDPSCFEPDTDPESDKDTTDQPAVRTRQASRQVQLANRFNPRAHELWCKAYDAAGNAGSSAPVTVFK